MHQTSLLTEEIDAIEPLLDTICAEYGSVEDPRLVEAAPLYSHELPRSIRDFLAQFRAEEASALCVLSGFPVDDTAIGATPPPGSRTSALPATLRQEVFFLLCASLLGDVFARAGRYGGQIMPDLVPGNDQPEDPLPAGSGVSLRWATEDAAGPLRADYIGLMCLRNPDDVATTVCDAGWIDWSRLDVDLLFRPEFPVRPDGGQPGLVQQPVLSGSRGRPYLALDPAAAVRDQMTPAARAAYDALVRAVDTAVSGIVLWPGDIAFVDNLRAVHGQEPFDARHDGTDRWFKRLTIARDLRRARSAYGCGSGRVFG